MDTRMASQLAASGFRSAIIVMLMLCSSCGISRGTINSYVEPTYEQGAIKRLALFPIRNAGRAPSEARDINVKIAQAISTKNPGVDIVAPAASVRTINDAGLADKWANFVEDYYTSGIANKVILKDIATALNVDGILQGQLVNVWQQDGDGWARKGQTRITVSFSIVETATGKQVWEASADGIKGNATELGSAPAIAEAIELAIAKIVENIPAL